MAAGPSAWFHSLANQPLRVIPAAFSFASLVISSYDSIVFPLYLPYHRKACFVGLMGESDCAFSVAKDDPHMHLIPRALLG